MFESRYQSFAELGGPTHGAERVAALRAELKRRNLQGFVVPRSDEHQNEYVAPSSERLLWLTGFAGSAGVAVVLHDAAAIFVDGRYTVQITHQADPKVFEYRHIVSEPAGEWIAKRLKPGDRLGYDPWLHTPEAVARLQAACAKASATLVAVEDNPIDAVWRDRPTPPLGKIASYPMKYAGESASAKLKRVRKALADADGLVVSDPHNLAWLFNIRGSDVAHTPLPLGFAYVPKEGRPTLFLDSEKLTPTVAKSLGEIVEIAEPGELVKSLSRPGGGNARIAFDSATAPARLTQILEAAGGKPEIAADPITLMKAAKNRTELEGTRAAHIRDGAAMARFLFWFDGAAKGGRLTEIAAAQALETFRRETGALKDVSFPSIAGAGPNSAIPHYRVSEASNRRIEPGVFLIDSGGQYEDGTTDITRTIAVGRPTKEMRDRFTRVLKGHIAVARAVFPVGATGAQIDAFARQSLWQAGLDFDHGTGHGVGVYLSVHEGPQRIAKTGTVALAPGMIVSNEPGYYAAGRFGIRIENLIVVEPRKIEGAEREMLGFETISLAPIDLRLVEPKLLDAGERAWLDAYHARVRKTLSPLVDAATRRWLAQATRKVGAAARRA